MTKVYFATNRKNPNPLDPAGYGAEMVGLDEQQILYASVEVSGIVLTDESSGVLGPIRRPHHGAFDPADANEIVASGNNVLVFVHGFANSFTDAIKRSAFNAEWFRSSGVPAADSTVLAFTWPSLGRLIAAPPHLPAADYLADQTQAGKSGFHLFHFLQKVAALRSQLPAGRRVFLLAHSIFLLAHSMGNYALQAAIQFWFTNGGAAARVFDEVILAAADERAGSFETGGDGRLSDLPKLTPRITIYHNINDVAMTLSMAINLTARIGFDGPSDKNDAQIYPPAPTAGRAGFRIVSCSQVRDYSWTEPPDATHQYYRRSPKVKQDIASVMGGTALPAGGVFALETPGVDISGVRTS
jgi:esterase/lipase superfamily enzyme